MPSVRRAPRFFVEGAHAQGEVVTFRGGDAHKLTTVLRRRSGDEIEVCDSAGQTFLARLQVEEGSLSALLVERHTRTSEPRLHLTLAQAVPRGAKMDFVVEKATELGVARIVPLLTERVESRPAAGKVERWRRLAAAAAAQSSRTSIPTVDDPCEFGAFLEGLSSIRVLLPWELAERVPLRERVPPLVDAAQDVAVVIGPEGGFSHAEVERARRAGAAVVSLGPRILRTETAGLAVLSVVLYAAGEL